MAVGCVVGLDLSLSSAGMVVLGMERGDVLLSESIASKAKGMQRVQEIVDRIFIRAGDHVVYLWVIEGYGFRSQHGNDLAELGGVVKFALHMESQDVLIVPPARLKKFVTGKGNAEKDQMRLAVFKRWGFEAERNDEVDAYALARLGLAFLGHDDRLTAAQAEVIRAIKTDLQKGDA